MAAVAVVGLGAMGSRIAGRLLDAGHEVVVWNRSADRSAPLVAAGAKAAGTPAGAARCSEVVVTTVSSPEALREVTEGPEGVAAGATGTTTVVQMSTVGPADVARLASVLRSRAALLDAPVLGSVTEAESGTLTVFAGGDPALVERWTPLLSVLGDVLPVGPLGAGTAAKLVANSTLLGVLGVLGEALALARGLGLPLDTAFEVLARTPLAAQAERRRPAVESRDAPVRFALSLARKDADLILEAAAAAATELRLAPATRAWLAEAEASGLGDADYSAVLGHILDAQAGT